jgi:hypothetical protein
MNPISPGVIEAAAMGSPQDRRSFYQAIADQIQAIALGTGVSLLEPVSGSSQKASTQPPKQATLTVTGANALYSIAITNPPQTVNSTIYHEISFSPSSNFSGNVTVLPITTATSLTYSAPGAEVYWRIRSSYDRSNWNSYRAGTSPVSASLQSSSATANNVVLNQSNYGYVDSVDAGSSANVRIYGAGGPGTSWIGVKGGIERKFPAATIVNVPYGVDRFVAYDGSQYRLLPNLTGVFPDEWTVVGKVSVVGSGAVVLPAISLVLDAHGRVIAWNVTSQGNGLTGPVTLSIVSSTGSGATPGTQTIEAGKLISVAPGNPGDLYQPTDTVTVSGGVFSGLTGGGTASGGNGGRCTNV